MHYVPFGDIDATPNIVVDGAPNAGTVLTLSHWPHSGTPEALRDDLSAQIAFHYLDHPELQVEVEVVTNNHFDQDGLASVYALVAPEQAAERRDQVIDVARAGDFGTFAARDSARIAWTIAALGGATSADPYVEVLARLPELLEHPERFRAHWAAEDAHLRESEEAIRAGTITIDERPEIDLAIVTVPPEWQDRTAHRFTQPVAQAVHPMAVNNATSCFRILIVHGAHYELQYRYETWVQYVSRRPPARVDLAPLAAELTALETGATRWTFDGVDAIAPALHTAGGEASTIPPERVCMAVITALHVGAPSWDPYD